MTVRRYGLEIVAEMSKFRSEIQRELPNATKKATDAAALQMAKRFARLREQELKETIKNEHAKAREAEKAAKRVAAAMEREQERAIDSVSDKLFKLYQDQEREAKGAELFNVEQEILQINDLKDELEDLNMLTERNIKILDERKDAARRAFAKSVGGKDSGPSTAKMKESAAAATNLSDKLSTVEHRAGEADSIIAALGGALGQLDPRLEAIARVGADAAGGLEAVARSGRKSTQVARLVGVAFGTVTAAAGLLALAQQRVQAQVDAANEKLGEASRKADRAARVYGKLSDSIRGISREHGIFVGGQDETLVSLQEQTEQLEVQRKQAIRTSEERIKGIERERDAFTKGKRVDDDLVKANSENRKQANKQIEREREKIVALNKRVDEAISNAEDIALGKKEEADKRDKNSDAITLESEALKRLQEQQQASSALRSAMLGKIQAEVEAQAALRAITADANSDQLTALQQIEARREASLVSLDQYILKQGMTAEAVEAAAAIEMRAEREKAEEVARLNAAADEIQADSDRKLQERSARQAEAQKQSAENAIMGVAMLSEQMSGVMGAAGRKGGQALIAAQKIVGARNIAISAKEAFARSLAIVPAPAGLPMAFGNAALALGQANAVEQISSSFDVGGVVRGGMVNRQTDSVPINTLPGESVLNTTATANMGEDEINLRNRGGVPGGGAQVVPAPWRHFDAFFPEIAGGYGSTSVALTHEARSGAYVGKR